MSYYNIPLSIVMVYFFVLGTTASAAATSSETFTKGNSSVRTTGYCGKNGSFCGTDGVRRPLTCENWYQFGPLHYTGYSESVPLECTSIPETLFGGLASLSLIYRCTNNTTWKREHPYDIQHGYNRKCTAKRTSLNSEFHCFSIDPMTDFGPFLRKTQAYDCGNENDISEFSYYYHLTRSSYSVDPYLKISSYQTIIPAHNRTVQFDRNFAVKGTIWANYTEYPQTDSPTVSPTVVATTFYNPTTEEAFSSTMIASGTTTAIATVGTTSLPVVALVLALVVVSMAPIL